MTWAKTHTMVHAKQGRTYYKAPAGPAVRPKHIVVQIGPCGRDSRLGPEPGYVGPFSSVASVGT